MRVLYSIVLLLALCGLTSSQAPIPSGGPDGWSVAPQPWGVPIVVDGFFDLLCGDSKLMRSNFEQVTDYYGDQLMFILHLFPLPYLHNGFLMAQATQVVAGNNPGEGQAKAVFEWMDAVFAVQDQFSTSSTMNMTTNDIMKQIASLSDKQGLVSSSQMMKGLALDSDYNTNARVSWKYGASRGVMGTPTMLVNGVNVNADATWTLTEWQQLFNGLTPNVTCTSDQTLCEYEPNTYACCLSGENCIPNVGCRC